MSVGHSRRSSRYTSYWCCKVHLCHHLPQYLHIVIGIVMLVCMMIIIMMIIVITMTIIIIIIGNHFRRISCNEMGRGGGGRRRLKKGIRGPPVCRSCPIVGTGWGGEGEREREREMGHQHSQGLGNRCNPHNPSPFPLPPFTSSDIPLSDLLELTLLLAGPPSRAGRYLTASQIGVLLRAALLFSRTQLRS